MPQKLLQVNFRFNIMKDEYENAAAEMAGAFAEVNGLKWKIWILNPENSEAGGIYLFESDEALNNYLGSPLAEQVKSHPAFSEMSVKPYDVMEKPTSICRGPVA